MPPLTKVYVVVTEKSYGGEGNDIAVYTTQQAARDYAHRLAELYDNKINVIVLEKMITFSQCTNYPNTIDWLS